MEFDFGGLEVKAVKNNIVYIEFIGICAGCPRAYTDLLPFLEKLIKANFPEIERVCIWIED